MKPVCLIVACAAGCLATGAWADDPLNDPTGLWKGFTIYAGQVLPVHPIFALEYKDGKLTGREIVTGAHNFEEDRPLLSPTFKDGVVSFDVMLPPSVRQGSGRSGMGGGAAAGAGGMMEGRGGGGGGMPVGGGGMTGGRGGEGGGGGSGGFHVPNPLMQYSDTSAGSSGGTVSYQGRLMGGAIIGTHTKQTNGGQSGPDIIDAQWAAARITPAGIWDLTMHDLPDDGRPADPKDPLHSVSGEFMRFEYQNLAVSGAWKRGPGPLVPIKAVSFTADGVAFSLAVEKPSGKILYEFTGSFVGTIYNDSVTTMPKVIFDAHGVQIEDAGNTLDLLSGKVKITGPAGRVYNSKWHLTRDDGKHARVEMGVPYEVPPKPAP